MEEGGNVFRQSLLLQAAMSAELQEEAKEREEVEAQCQRKKQKKDEEAKKQRKQDEEASADEDSDSGLDSQSIYINSLSTTVEVESDIHRHTARPDQAEARSSSPPMPVKNSSGTINEYDYGPANPNQIEKNMERRREDSEALRARPSLTEDEKSGVFEANIQPLLVSKAAAELLRIQNEPKGRDIKLNGEPYHLPGVGNYSHHVGSHNRARQQQLSIKFKKQVVRSLVGVAPDIDAYIKEVIRVGGFENDYDVYEAHALICGGSSVSWKWHTDASEDAASVKLRLTVICAMTTFGNTSMMVAGAEGEYVYQEGKFIVFDSNLFHRSGKSMANTIKLSLFLEKKKKTK